MKVSRSEINERHRTIYNFLLENQAVTVEQLSQLIGVSNLTIRRDLSFMENEYAIERFHGGVRLKKDIPVHLPAPSLFSSKIFTELSAAMSDVRALIGKKAAEFIDYEDTIFVNGSTTVLEMIKYIDREKRVSIVTNNSLMPFVEGASNVSILITGGQVYENFYALVGEPATQTISKVHTSKCIMGAYGISAESGITTLNYQHSEINEKMVSMCNGQVIVVAEGKKIGRSHSFISCSIEKIHTLITDSTADVDEVHRLVDAGVEVIIVDKME